MAAKTVRLWSGTRCVTHDRLPLVGPLEASPSSGLWICTGMGSRGLSLAALCAELLAAYIHSEPLPLEHTLSKSLFVNRPAKGRRSAERSDSAD
jgi:tRNA 5-methylaminomethyl-2-thiouridine biosynthesis bifunctional protein